MLDFIYYPVSGIMWFWHKVFGAVLGPDNGFAWALSVMFLVFTVRVVLLYPAITMMRTTRQMQKLQPHIQALKDRYADDKPRRAAEMQKLQKEHGVKPLLGCLPMFVQLPVFLGLYHVLRSFNRTGTAVGGLGMTPEENANTANYVFSVADVQSFLSARLFGVPISAAITSPQSVLESFAPHGGIPTMATIAAVAIPLMLIASLATHFNARASIAWRSQIVEPTPPVAVMNKLMLWVFPLGALTFGWFLPVAILLYWVSNNLWTYCQQHLLFRHIDRQEAAKEQEAAERRSTATPEPEASNDQAETRETETESANADRSTD